MDDNFNFELVSDFSSYNSSRDKTNLAPSYFVKGSKNVFKKLSGTMGNRYGRKLRGPLNNTAAGVVASYEWQTSFGAIRPIRVTADGTMQFEYSLNGVLGWYTLMSNLTKTRFTFTPWTDTNQFKEILIMANGSNNMVWEWEGGVAVVAATSPAVPGVIVEGEISIGSNSGSGYQNNDIVTINGGNFNAQVTITSTSGGAVESFQLTQQGSGYPVDTGGSHATTALTGSGTGLTVIISQVVTAGTITKTVDGNTFFQDGFGAPENFSSRQFIYNGITYTYGTGTEGNTLQAVTPDPSGIPAGAVIYSAPVAYNNIPFANNGIENPIFANFAVDIVFTNQSTNQLMILSYSNSLIFASDGNEFFTDFIQDVGNTQNTAYTIALDNPPTGISVKGGNLIIFAGVSLYYEIQISTQTVDQGGNNPASIEQVVTTTKTDLRENAGPAGQEFIDTDGNYIVWLGQDSQVHVLGAVKDVFLSDKAPSLSQALQDELTEVDFTGGHLKWIGEFIFITAPKSGVHYMYQERQYFIENGAQKTEQIWHAPQIEGISRFANIDGLIYGHSNINPMIFAIFNTNQWHDDGADSNNNLVVLSYESRLSMAYMQLPGKGKTIMRPNSLKFDKLYFEGYIQPGTALYGNIYYDYQGASGSKGIYINGVPSAQDSQNPLLAATKREAILYGYAYIKPNAPSLGYDFLGDNPLGQGITPFANNQDYLPKFRTIVKSMGITFCREFQLEIYSVDADARWEILSLGANIEEAPQGEYELTR